jgi:hypothetical protein
MSFGFSSLGLDTYGFGNKRLIWTHIDGAVSYNIYHSTNPGLSTRFSPILENTTELSFDLVGLASGSINFFIMAAVGPNDELSPPSNELMVIG